MSFKADPDVYKVVKRLMSIAYVQPDDVQDIFNLITNAAPSSTEPLLSYFKKQWLQSIPLSMWNIHGIEVTTNNSCEGWHLRFNRAVNKCHANIWHFLKCLQDEQSTTDLTRLQTAAGQNVVRIYKKFVKYKQRITTLLHRYKFVIAPRWHRL